MTKIYFFIHKWLFIFNSMLPEIIFEPLLYTEFSNVVLFYSSSKQEFLLCANFDAIETQLYPHSLLFIYPFSKYTLSAIFPLK